MIVLKNSDANGGHLYQSDRFGGTTPSFGHKGKVLIQTRYLSERGTRMKGDAHERDMAWKEILSGNRLKSEKLSKITKLTSATY